MPINPATLLKHKKQLSEYSFARKMHSCQHTVHPRYHVVVKGIRVSDDPVTMNEFLSSGMKLSREVQLLPVT